MSFKRSYEIFLKLFEFSESAKFYEFVLYLLRHLKIFVPARYFICIFKLLFLNTLSAPRGTFFSFYDSLIFRAILESGSY